MNSVNLKYKLLVIAFIMLGFQNVSTQSYTKDSLQIKVYTEIEYKNNRAEQILLKKVFCDYCSEKQSKSIADEALRRADIEKYYPENRLENGSKRLAIYIRISKEDFAAIKQDE